MFNVGECFPSESGIPIPHSLLVTTASSSSAASSQNIHETGRGPDQASLPGSEAEPPPVLHERGARPQSSRGSLGHPFGCAKPCRAVQSQRGCRYGSQCQWCHECSVDIQVYADTWKCHPCRPDAEAVRCLPTSAADEPFPSVGSIGHPWTCGEACRDHRRERGCRKGILCDYCHLCHWSRILQQSSQHSHVVNLREWVLKYGTESLHENAHEVFFFKTLPYTKACAYHCKSQFVPWSGSSSDEALGHLGVMRCTV